MKKILFILMLCVSMVACKKHEIEDVETTPMVTITFDQQIVSSNSMVRSTTNEFLDIIEEQTPSYINVTLKNLDLGKTYTCKSNESITIPLGNYEVSGYYKSESNSGYLSAPYLKCDTFNLNIKYDIILNLNTYYNCYAVFALIDECKTCTYGGGYSFDKKGKYYVKYFDETNITTLLTPYDDSTEFITTTYDFSTTYTIGKVYAEYGKYYVIHPQKVDKTSCFFNVDITDMQKGEI